MKQQDEAVYQFPYHEDNMYGHVVTLLGTYVGRVKEGEDSGIHLDIGCGYGAIAPHIVSNLGSHYVGIDGSEYGLRSLRAQGFETHQMFFDGSEATRQKLIEVIAGRRVRSISMLDLIEHLPETEKFLMILADIAREHQACFVLSCPNNTHRDIATRLLLGKWDYTKIGLLDHTHIKLFGEDTLLRSLHSVGFFPIERHNVCYDISEQHFPEDCLALTSGSSLNNLLFSVADQANIHSRTYQFVWICQAKEPKDITLYVDNPAGEERPFLSIIMRTQGRRPHTFNEALTALIAQTDNDFELLIIGHQLEAEKKAAINAMLHHHPQWFQEKCRLIEVGEGNRTRPLNVGFAAARGNYIAILDDDDLPFAHWVETYHHLAQKHPGRVLRAACVVQNVETVVINGQQALRACGPLEHRYPGYFDFITHFHHNQSPPVSLAFPRSAYQDLNIHFDETLTTTEDWDFLLRVVAICNVASSPEITAIYRWWVKDESSRTQHDQQEWQENYKKIIKKTAEMPIILPPGLISQIVEHFYPDIKEHQAEPDGNVAELSKKMDLAHFVTPDRVVLRAYLLGIKVTVILLKIKKFFVFPFKGKRRRLRNKIRKIYDMREKLKNSHEAKHPLTHQITTEGATGLPLPEEPKHYECR